jgi:hypothetical protein
MIALAAAALVPASSMLAGGSAAAEVLPPGGLAGGAIGPSGDPTAYAGEAASTNDTGQPEGGGGAQEPSPCTWVSVDRETAFEIFRADGRTVDDEAERWSVRRCTEPNGSISMEVLPQGDAVDPAALAAQAVESVSIPVPVIATSPDLQALIVQVPTWLWVDSAWWTTYSATASAGDVSATVAAQPTSATWSTGDGATVTCQGPGAPWVPGMAEEASDCTHVYTSSSEPQPAGSYPLSVTVEFGVTWTSNIGASGSLPALSRTASTQVQVGEIQAIETR